MGKRQKDWARRARVELRARLGDTCTRCGSVDALQFDCIIPQGDWHHKLEYSHLTSFYRAEAARGNLQLLCEDCHNRKSKGERRRNAQELVFSEAENPF